MKVLGLSFGRKNANTDILVKEALYGVKEAYPDAENRTADRYDRAGAVPDCAAVQRRDTESPLGQDQPD